MSYLILYLDCIVLGASDERAVSFDGAVLEHEVATNGGDTEASDREAAACDGREGDSAAALLEREVFVSAGDASSTAHEPEASANEGGATAPECDAAAPSTPSGMCLLPVSYTLTYMLSCIIIDRVCAYACADDRVGNTRLFANTLRTESPHVSCQESSPSEDESSTSDATSAPRRNLDEAFDEVDQGSEQVAAAPRR